MTRSLVETIADAGLQKYQISKQSPGRYFVRAMMAGGYIFIGSLFSCLCAAWFYDSNLPVAKLLAAITFSSALTLVVFLGGELFTGCNMIMAVSLYEEKVPPSALLRIWGTTYVGNFVGIFILCIILVGSSASHDLLASYLAIIIPAKLNLPWYTLVLKGVLCNFMVCLGVFAGFKLKSEAGRFILIVMVISTFVFAGLEHSIANMAFFLTHIMLTPSPDLAGMGWNLLWVTVGNILGGAVLLGLPLWYAAEIKTK